MNSTEYNMILWGVTLKGAKDYPLTRTEEQLIQERFEEHLHKVMHRPSEQQIYE